MKDKLERTLAKTLSWRVVATLTTIALVWIFTGRLILALGVGAADIVAKSIAYFLHERIWQEVSWGR